MSLQTFGSKRKLCLPEVVSGPGLQDLGGPKAGGGKQGDDQGGGVGAHAVSAAPGLTVTVRCD